MFLSEERQAELINNLLRKAVSEFQHMPLRSRYSIYLRSPRWQIKRLQALSRDKDICQICKENEATQVHHLHYDNCGNENLEDLISLCRFCHLKVDSEAQLRRYENQKNDKKVHYMVRGALADYLVQSLQLTYEEVKQIRPGGPDIAMWLDVEP